VVKNIYKSVKILLQTGIILFSIDKIGLLQIWIFAKKTLEETMKMMRYLPVAILLLILVASGCGKNKEIPIVEPPPNPLALAHEAAAQGARAYQDEDLQEALAAFTSAQELFLEAQPTASEADSVDVNIERMQLNIAKTYMDMAFENAQFSMFEDALADYEKALAIYQGLVPLTIDKAERDASIGVLYRNMALTAQNAGQYERSLVFYDRVLEYEPGNEDILNIKYSILKDNIKDEARAMQVLKDYAQVSNDYRAYLILADRYRENGDNTNAALYYEKALELEKSSAVFTKVADFYRATGDFAKSNQILEQYVATKPEAASLGTIYRVMADNFDKLKNTAKRIEHLEKSVEVDPNADVALVLANHYYQAKNYNKVITYATQVINLDASKTAAFLLRGDSYYRLKRNAEARADLTRIQNDPVYGASAQSLLKAIK